MGVFRKEPAVVQASRSLLPFGARQAVRGGLAAGGTFLVVSVASAVTSAVRRRGEGS